MLQLFFGIMLAHTDDQRITYRMSGKNHVQYFIRLHSILKRFMFYPQLVMDYQYFIQQNIRFIGE
jgi:hypothetical protein